jgi:hypothetical protein
MRITGTISVSWPSRRSSSLLPAAETPWLLLTPGPTRWGSDDDADAADDEEPPSFSSLKREKGAARPLPPCWRKVELKKLDFWRRLLK